MSWTFPRWKTSQAEVSSGIAAKFERAEQADGRIVDLENGNGHLSAQLLRRSKQCDELEQAVQDAANQDRWHNLQLIGVKEWLGASKLQEYVRQLVTEVLRMELGKNELQSLAIVPDEGRPSRSIIRRF